MKFAYADPPYLGLAKRFYGDLHPEAAEYDKKEKHVELIARLMDEFPDGWAVSLHAPTLPFYCSIIPKEARVCAWTKTIHQIWWNVTVQYAWEPVILYGGRKEKNRRPMTRDYLNCARAQRKGLRGSKPDKFNDWVLDLLNYKIGDEIVDLFPGTNGMAAAVERRLIIE
jgi:hypothetical protein